MLLLSQPVVQDSKAVQLDVVSQDSDEAEMQLKATDKGKGKGKKGKK